MFDFVFVLCKRGITTPGEVVMTTDNGKQTAYSSTVNLLIHIFTIIFYSVIIVMIISLIIYIILISSTSVYLLLWWV